MVNPYNGGTYWPSTSPINNQPSNQILWVQGEAGAKAYPVAPGSTVLLMDSEENCFFIKSSDSSGIPQPLRVFDYSERVSSPSKDELLNKDYVTREEFNELKKMLDDLTK